VPNCQYVTQWRETGVSGARAVFALARHHRPASLSIFPSSANYPFADDNFDQLRAELATSLQIEFSNKHKPVSRYPDRCIMLARGSTQTIRSDCQTSYSLAGQQSVLICCLARLTPFAGCRGSDPLGTFLHGWNCTEPRYAVALPSHHRYSDTLAFQTTRAFQYSTCVATSSDGNMALSSTR
jgi:hypothetical protein